MILPPETSVHYQLLSLVCNEDGRYFALTYGPPRIHIPYNLWMKAIFIMKTQTANFWKRK